LSKDERGMEMVEFALVVLLLFFVLFSIMEFSRAIWVYGTVAHAAREGARFAIVRGSESPSPATTTQVRNHVRSMANGLPVTVTTTWTPNKNPGSVVSVKVDYTYQPALQLVPKSLFGMNITSTSEMVITF
jgi:Flp pilus assembly protein TadG